MWLQLCSYTQPIAIYSYINLPLLTFGQESWTLSSKLLHDAEQRAPMSLLCKASWQVETSLNTFVATVHWASKPHKSLYVLTAAWMSASDWKAQPSLTVLLLAS